MHLSFLARFAVAAVFAFNALGHAYAAEYKTLNPEASRLAFIYSQMSVNMDGSFRDMSATQFTFDPAKPEAASVVFEVPLGGIDAGYGEANDEAGKAEWLDIAQYPLARFESSKVEALGENRYQVAGQLTIKNHTHDISAPFTFTQEDGAGVFDGAFTFKRADFGIGEGVWGDFGIVANEIQIKFHIVATE